mgnify:CR=1 FL=1|tara:strand:+ start:236 stop:658 length:423 start_codon:yes stop_codon:yes gene_type:complete
MPLKARQFIVFDRVMYDLHSTQEYMRNLYGSESISEAAYASIGSTLNELRVGYPYEDTDLLISPDGRVIALTNFFLEWGQTISGGFADPINVDNESIQDDLVSELSFFTEMEAIDIMNDDIGGLDEDSDYTLGSEDTYSI